MTQTTLREYLRTTEDAISSGRIDEAMANCQNILTYFPQALEAQRLLGEVYLAQNRLQEAQQTFEWILTNDPENVIVYCDRALISERTSDVDTALDCYQQAYELSRGNANIRQEFNQISAQAGQQEFMFSRAGLARLYMRGDLLTQAIQEWEAVLAISPERLDARLGLMETYWREGMFDKAEQVATQLLEEIPTCLKALLFLAHITSLTNIQRAQELLKRAEELDPDLRVAQDVFADLSARVPNDPFLELIKREPVVLENGVPINLPKAAVPAAKASNAVPASPSQYGTWETLNAWEQESPANALLNTSLSDAPIHAGEENGFSSLPAASSFEEEEIPTWQGQLGEAASSFESELPTWQGQTGQPVSTSKNEQPWYQEDAFAQGSPSPIPASWDSQNAEEEEEQGPLAPPSWLSTLTQNEQRPAEPSTSSNRPATPEPLTRSTPSQELKAQESEAMPFFFQSDDDESEEETNWPEWLKSLGAESLEPEASPSSELVEPVRLEQVAPTLPTPPQETASPFGQATSEDPWSALPMISANNDAWSESSSSQPDWMQQLAAGKENSTTQNSTPEWMQQLSTNQEDVSLQNTQASTPEWMQSMSEPEDAPSQNSTPEWMQQFSAPTTAAPSQNSNPEWMSPPTNTGNQSSYQTEQEERYLASLEDLEKSLQSQGFTPLVPGSLAAIASNQQSEAVPTSAPFQPQEQPTLSSALAQLGNLSQPNVAPTANSNAPWWNSMMSAPAEPSLPSVPHTPGEPVNPFAALGAQAVQEAPQLSPLPATPRPQATAFEPATSNHNPATEITLTPAYRSDALLDNDLETTMKRPAIKLQPMQKGEPGNALLSNGKSHSERKLLDHTDDANLSSHERLVRGYQYQLSGAYDEAMQEYRLIIRNAPELLDDVISNMRALLKLNPRFSVGYRVLGDAYMRKGEYLQAMESYNKALTMAKKARH